MAAATTRRGSNATLLQTSLSSPISASNVPPLPHPPASSPAVDLESTIMVAHPATNLAKDILCFIRNSVPPGPRSEFYLVTVLQTRSESILNYAGSVLRTICSADSWNFGEAYNVGTEVLPMVERLLQTLYILGINEPPEFSPPCRSFLGDCLFIYRTFNLRQVRLAAIRSLETLPGSESAWACEVHDRDTALSVLGDAFSRFNADELSFDSLGETGVFVIRTVTSNLKIIQDVIHKSKQWRTMPEESFQIVARSLLLLLSVCSLSTSLANDQVDQVVGDCRNSVNMLLHEKHRYHPPDEGCAQELIDLLSQHLTERSANQEEVQVSYPHTSISVSRLDTAYASLESQLLALYRQTTKMNTSNEILLGLVREAANIRVRWRRRSEWLLCNLPKLYTLRKTKLVAEVGTLEALSGVDTEDRLSLFEALITLMQLTNLLDWDSENSSPAVTSKRMEAYQRWENLEETGIFVLEDSPEARQHKPAYQKVAQADEEEYDRMRPLLPSPSSSELFKAAIMCIRKNINSGTPA